MRIIFNKAEDMVEYIKTHALEGETFVSFTDNTIYTDEDAKEAEEEQLGGNFI